MDLPDALAYLDAHINLEARAGRIDGLSLESITALLAALGDPQRAFKVVHITGTNGKGSVAAMVTRLLMEHGLAVATFTSPHLEQINERMRWNLQPIDDESLASAVGHVAAIEPLSGVTLSYFEILTAAAFSWFAEIAVDVAVVEVGLLGRFDATNVVDADVAVVTNVGRDHTDGLGTWRESLAREKAGIIKAGSMVVLGDIDADIRPIFEAETEAVGAIGLWTYGEDYELVGDRLAVGGHLVDIRTPGGVLDDLYLPLYGRHQAENAAVAVVATEAFFGRPVERDLVESAFNGLVVAGRFEVIGRAPLVILDGAHNPPGAAAAAETLADDFEVPGRRILVVGFLTGHDPTEMLDALDARTADVVIACEPPSPRAVPVAEVVAAGAALGIDVTAVRDVADALREALFVSTPDDVILVTGSLYLLAPARAAAG